MPTGKAIALGIGVGIIAYCGMVTGLGLMGVSVGELDKFPAYVGCLAKREASNTEADASCQQLRSYFRGDGSDPWRVEELAAAAVAAGDRLSATAKNDTDEIFDVWIKPILRRLEMAADVAKDIFAP